MSRSWERMVRKNTSVVNKKRKKQGGNGFISEANRVDRFKGRNIILPLAVIFFTGFYAYISFIARQAAVGDAGNTDTLYWITIACYILLSLLFFFRRPYLNVAKEFVQTRRFTGDKMLRANGIKQINVQDGYVVIEQVKGPSWVFSRFMNRFPTNDMAERLKQFAKDNQIEFVEKA
ncbi:hypothetical protein ACFOQM_20705 [Paenibacillus sp. GCM10012307]|uniref:Methyltransferase n=1 Tax=Paenibacillus roseus TaxID=2798579 RepID=A0A934JB91_9BACL|nr:hypothetical protein [Paenibacillus roseus]MBJ6363650.1 hypothetical protein [Paenibacillus roseus]